MNPLFTTNQSASNYLNSISSTKKASPFSLNVNSVSTTPSSPNATSPIVNNPPVQNQTPAVPTVNTTKPAGGNSDSAYLKFITGVGDTGLTEAQVKANLAAYNAKNPPMTTPAPKTAQQTYLDSLRVANTPSSEELAQRKNLTDINNNIFGTKFYGAEESNRLFDTPGGLKSGAIDASNRSAMRSNQELARLAVQQNAAANSLNALTANREAQQAALKPVQIGNDYYDPTTGEKLYADTSKNNYITLADGATLFDPKTGKIVASNPKDNSTTPVPGENPQLYSGLSNPTATAIRSKVSALKTEPIITNFNTINEGYNFAKSLPNDTKNPADDQALIYSLAKALDPNSVVREGEYATAQKYAQSWIKSFGKGVEQAISGTGFLSEDARKNIKNTIESRYKTSKANYDNLIKQYSSSISALTGRNDGDKFLVDYSGAFGSNDSSNETSSGVTPSGIKYSIVN